MLQGIGSAQARQQAAAMQADLPRAMDQVWMGRNEAAMHPEPGIVVIGRKLQHLAVRCLIKAFWSRQRIS